MDWLLGTKAGVASVEVGGPLAGDGSPVQPAPVEPARGQRLAPWLIVACYLVIAVGLTGRLWAHPAARIPSSGHRVESDVLLNAWFMRYVATAVAHGGLPALVTTAVNAPHGINVMWNTSLLLPGLLLAPVTLLAGPVPSLLVLLTLGFAGSAASMLYVLRRWGASLAAAAVGGALYGFSPALMTAAEDHYHLQFAVLPPLIIDAALGLATGRRRLPWAGLWLGLLIAAQLFIAEELLVDTALAGAIVVAMLALNRARPALDNAGRVTAGLCVAVGTVLLICGRALWVQFFGPLTEAGSPWHIHRYGNLPADMVTAPSAVVLHGSFLPFLKQTGQWPVEYFGYLGWPLLAAVAAATIWYWADIRVRTAGLTFAALELLSVGGHNVKIGSWQVPGRVLPWHWLERFPLLGQALPNRIPILADGAAAAVIAFGVTLTLARIPARGPTAARWRWPAVSAAAAVLALALLPVLPRPVPAVAVAPVPRGWAAVIARLDLPPGAAVLTLPVDGARAMEWQAVTGAAISVIGGYCVAPGHYGHAAQCGTWATQTRAESVSAARLSLLARGRKGHRGPSPATMAAAISGWRPAAIVVTAGRNTRIGRYLIRHLGPPTITEPSVLGWRIRDSQAAVSVRRPCAARAACTPSGPGG
jgi:hypothetical protein